MCCCTPITIRKQRKISGDLIVVVLHREAMRLDRLHEQAITRTLPHHELVQLCLTIKVLFKLLLRQTIGMVASLQKMAGLDCARLHDTLPTAEGLGRPDPVSSRHTALRPCILEALDRIPRPKQDRGEDARPQGLW